MNDQQLLERAAKAAGMDPPFDKHGIFSAWVGTAENGHWWDPLNDDGDALRLAVKLHMHVLIHADWVEVLIDGIQIYSTDSCYSTDGCMRETTRRAIVRAAAEIDKATP
ncbi:hypothetical protein BK655_12510 [Pseudomonas brassicacearum]|uniref:hypothetical protein n=1 Tax=Pseudomonas brassicacearum TaxID=930166 RepID=UPI000F46F205|nr:hypothetical protein [Pseudomonas brassicacearum]ROM84164.1 hypothetical protein BK655_12510 [Pseudomonas brassicacearum]